MFIAFEGLDGSGSTTQAQKLAERFQQEGRHVLMTKEPTSESPIGKMIRDVLQHQWEASAEGLQLLFSADRAEHLKNEILPALEEGKIVITDRYKLSTLAFGALAVDMDWLEALNRYFRAPDVTFLLQLSPEKCIERIKKRGQAMELFEQQEKLEKIWKNYEKAATRFEAVHVIDADRPIDVIASEVWGLVETHLKR